MTGGRTGAASNEVVLAGNEQLLGGRYRVLRRIAQGGMAAVYLARMVGPQGFQKLVVVKKIHQHLADQDEFVRMFLEEGRLSADLRHPNIVNVLEVAEHDGAWLLVMEYLHGQDVGKIMHRHAKRQERIPLGHALQIIMEAAAGLNYAHAKTDPRGQPLHIIHRDVSPQNILVTYEGVAKVVDFGIAKAAGQAMETASGILKGKIAYMAPEQASGHDFDARADQFALGVVLYELTTMKRLFKRESDILTLHAVVGCEIERPALIIPGYPPELEDIVLTALAREPADRFRDCAQLVTALEDFATRERVPRSAVRLGTYLKEMFEDTLRQDESLLKGSEDVPMDAATSMSALARIPEVSAGMIVSEASAPMPPPPLAEDFDDDAPTLVNATPPVVPPHPTGPLPPSSDDPTEDLVEPGTSGPPARSGSDPVSALTLTGTQGSAGSLRRTNIPMDTQGFIGRARELAQLEELLTGGTRLVTLVGPGGTGKTRLARHFAATRLKHWTGSDGGGAWWVDVSQARSADDINRAVGQALNVALTTGKSTVDSIQQLGHAMAGRGRVLVVLDNFEQLVEHAAATVGAWMDVAPSASFLVSSREPLHLPGEQAFDLPPLGVPRDPDEVRYSDAVQLFVSRARAVRPNWQLGDEDLPAVAEIVRVLDGLPLAIELAAARMAVLPAPRILERLNKRFELLTSGPRNTGRHRTMRDAIDWSWQLLTPAEQSALLQCAVFRGSFDLEAAEAVIDLSGEPEAPAVMDAVQSLREKSLLRSAESAGGEVRFGLYESVRAFAEEKFSASPLKDAAFSRHAAHYVTLGRTLAERVDGPEGALVRRQLATEMDNLLAVMHRNLGAARPSREAVTRGLEAVLAADPVLSTRGPVAQHLDQLTTAVKVAAAHGVSPSVLAEVHKARGWALLVQGRAAESEADYNEAIRLARASGNVAIQGRALGELGIIRRQQGRLDDATAAYEEAISLCRSAGDERSAAMIMGNLANLDRQARRLELALQRSEDALTLLRRVGDGRSEAILLGGVALLQQEMGSLPDAVEKLERAVDLAHAAEDKRTEAVAMGFLGTVLFEMDELERGRSHLKKSVATLRQVGDRRFEGVFRAVFAGVEAALHKPEESRTAFEGAARVLREVDDRHGLAVLDVYEALRDVLRADDARNHARPADEEKLRTSARARLAEARAPAPATPERPQGGPSWADQSDLVRAALRIVEKRVPPA